MIAYLDIMYRGTHINYSTFQGIDDLDLSAFEYGGVNITGFSIVNQQSTQKQKMQNVVGKITVSNGNSHLVPVNLMGSAIVVKTISIVKPGIA